MIRVFKNANVIDVLGKTLLENRSVVVTDGIISAIGPDYEGPADDTVDLGGKYLMPGLFNLHVHITLDSRPNLVADSSSIVEHTLTALDNLEQLVRSGVVFARDLGSHDYIAVELKNLIKKGKLKMAPELQAAGPCICMTGGGNWNICGYEADGPDELKKAARTVMRNKADWLKLMATGTVNTPGTEPGCPQLTEEELRAAIEEGHKAGIKSAAHAQGNTGIKNAIRAGIDCVEHGYYLDQEAIQLMLEHGTYLCPTVSPTFMSLANADKGVPADTVRKAKALVEVKLKSFRAAYDAGVPCVLGTDCGCPFNYHSLTAMDLVLMVEKCGLSPMETFVIGTINSARLCGVEDRLGSVTVGKQASFAIFANNPLEDIRATLDCAMTVKCGEILHVQ